MISPIKKRVVAPYDIELMKKLNGISTVITTNDIENVTKIRDESKKIDKDFDLFCIKVTSDKSLSEIELSDELNSIPLALYVPEIGDLSKILVDVRRIRSFNTQIFLPADNKKNIRDLRILASVGINCGFYIDDEKKDIDWEQLDDLLYYFSYSKVKKGSIEPFNYMVTTDSKNDTFDLKTVYFNSPHSFLHVDVNENIALSFEDLANSKFIGKGVDSLSSLIEEKIKVDRASMFIESEECSFCSSFRVCRSEYYEQCKKHKSYKVLFESILGVIEVMQVPTENNGLRKWQL